MSDYEWEEALPEKCPPEDSLEADGKTYYRLADAQKATAQDFESHRVKFPGKDYKKKLCEASSVSLCSDLQAALQKTKVGSLQGKLVVSITLPPKSGLIKKTGRDPHHWSWWRAKGFDLLAHCTEVKP